MDDLSFTDSELDFHVRNALKAVVQVFVLHLVSVMLYNQHLANENLVSRVSATFITSLWL